MNVQNMILFFGLWLVSVYVYWKGLNLPHITRLKMAAAILCALVMSVPLSYAPFLYEVLFTVSVMIFVSLMARVQFSLMFSAALISIGISLGIMCLSEITLVFLGSLMWAVAHESFLFRDEATMGMALQVTGLVLSLSFAYLLFRIKRLKNGFAFLNNRGARWTGIAFAVLIAVCRSARGFLGGYIVDDDGITRLVFFLFFVTVASTIGIYFWWRYGTSALYQQRLDRRAIQMYQAMLAEKESEAKRLMDSNQFLSEAVHRDNKLIPAMHKAVSDYLANTGTSTHAEAEGMGQRILGELGEMMRERQTMIQSVQRNPRALPSTEMPKIDRVLHYMHHRSSAENIQFDFFLSERVKDKAESVIEKQNLEVLLADLIENAMIAVSCCPEKRILVTMGIIENCFEIAVQDSGIPFEPETLRVLGLKKATTHADSGGKGIGFLTIFKILGQSAASLVIVEHTPGGGPFTKSIKVRFDGKSEFAIHTYRAEKIQPSVNRQGMLVFKIS